MGTPAEVIGAIRTNTAEIGVAKQKINEINAAVSSELSTLTEATEKGTVVGTAGRPTTVLAEKQQLQAQISEQAANQRRAETVGFEDHSNEILKAIKQASAARSQKLDEINAINTSSNPLEHIAGLVTIPFKEAQAKGFEEVANAKTQELAVINQLMQSSAKTTQEIQTRVTEATAASISEALTHDQIAETARLKIQALQTGAQGIKEVLNLSEQQLRNSIKEFDIGEAVEMRALRKQQIQSMIDAREDAKEGKNVREGVVDMINLALASNGKEMIPEGQRALIADQVNKPGQYGETLRTLLDSGAQIAMAGGQVIQGSTPTEAAGFREKINYVPQNETERDTLAIVDGLMRSAAVPGKDGTPAPKNRAELEAAANQNVKNKLAQDENNISTDRNSLAKPISWATMAASDGFRNNKVFKEVIAPQITDNISTNAVEPIEFFKRLSTAVKSGSASIDDAVQLYQNYGALSIHMNNRATGLMKFTGFQQTQFKVSLPQPRAATKLFNFPGTDVGVPGISQAANAVTGMLPHANVSIDVKNPAAVYNAFASYLSGELKDSGVKTK